MPTLELHDTRDLRYQKSTTLDVDNNYSLYVSIMLIILQRV
jgi:hypothetical protein